MLMANGNACAPTILDCTAFPRSVRIAPDRGVYPRDFPVWLMETNMNHQSSSLLRAAGSAEMRSNSVFGTPAPRETLVKEVVMFKPAPDPYEQLQRAGQRAQTGRSVFADTVQGELQDQAGV